MGLDKSGVGLAKVPLQTRRLKGGRMQIIIGGVIILVGLVFIAAVMHLTGASEVGCRAAEVLAGPLKSAVEVINLCWLG